MRASHRIDRARAVAMLSAESGGFSPSVDRPRRSVHPLCRSSVAKREDLRGGRMGNIRKVTVRVATGDLEGAGTTGEVYLGLAGMEFKMNSMASGRPTISVPLHREGACSCRATPPFVGTEDAR